MLGLEKGFSTYKPGTSPPTRQLSQPKSASAEPKPGWGEGLLAASWIGVNFSVDKTKGNHQYCIYLLYLQGTFMRQFISEAENQAKPLPRCSFVTQPQAPGRCWIPWLRWWHQAPGEQKTSFHLGHLDLFLAFLCLLNPKCWCRRMGCMSSLPVYGQINLPLSLTQLKSFTKLCWVWMDWFCDTNWHHQCSVLTAPLPSIKCSEGGSVFSWFHHSDTSSWN